MVVSRLVGGDSFLAILTAYRSLWLAGRFGGGKTALATWLAGYLAAAGLVRRVHTNYPCAWSTPPAVPVRDAVCVIDESWLFVDSWRRVRGYAAFSRKLNTYLLLPSVFPPHHRLRFLSVQRALNGYSFGLPFWVYRWMLGLGSVREKGYFAWLYPHRIFAEFDTAYIPADDGGILDALTATMAGFDIADAGGEGVFSSGELEAVLADTAATFESAAESISRTARRRWRR